MDIQDYITNISSDFKEFASAILDKSPVAIDAVFVVGSVLTPDFIKGQSDINSIVVTEDVSLEFLDFMVELGKEYSPRSIAAPLLMTPEYIETSLDVFPVEFLNFHAIHHTLSGPDLLQDLSIERVHLRLQCEREMKSKLLWLHQGYIESLGNEQQLIQRLSNSITGFIPLFRAILFLSGRPLSLSARDTVTALEQQTGQNSTIFTQILELKLNNSPATGQHISDWFSDYYTATRHLTDYVDELVD